TGGAAGHRGTSPVRGSTLNRDQNSAWEVRDRVAVELRPRDVCGRSSNATCKELDAGAERVPTSTGRRSAGERVVRDVHVVQQPRELQDRNAMPQRIRQRVARE